MKRAWVLGIACSTAVVASLGVEGTDADLLRRLWDGVDVRDVLPSRLPVES